MNEQNAGGQNASQISIGGQNAGQFWGTVDKMSVSLNHISMKNKAEQTLQYKTLSLLCVGFVCVSILQTL